MRKRAPLLLAAALAVAFPAAAVDLPQRRSGVWEVVTATPGAPSGPAAQLCIDEKTDDLARQLAQGMVNCSRQDVRRDGDGYVVDSVCRLGESTATTRARITGRFDAAYRIDVAATYEPPLMGLREGRASVDARWTGPCRAGQRAGDMTLPGGVTINIFDAPPGGAPRKSP